MFRQFLNNFLASARPLKDLKRKAKVAGAWNEKGEISFEQLQNALVNAPILIDIKSEKPFLLHVDALQTAVGGILAHDKGERRTRVIKSTSKTLSSTERNYTAKDQALLALVNELQRLR